MAEERVAQRGERSEGVTDDGTYATRRRATGPGEHACHMPRERPDFPVPLAPP